MDTRRIKYILLIIAVLFIGILATYGDIIYSDLKPSADETHDLGTSALNWDTLYVADIVNKGPTIDVRAYGVVGDGETDDTAAIQAAIDDLPATGGVLSFPAGNYYCASSINPYHTGMNMRSEPVIGTAVPLVVFQGMSMETTKIFTDQDIYLIRPVDSQYPDVHADQPSYFNLTIRDLTLQGNIGVTDSIKEGTGIYFQRDEISILYILLERVKIRLFYYGYRYDGYEDVSGPKSNGHLILQDSYILWNTIGIHNGSDNLTIQNSRILRNFYYGLHFIHGTNLIVRGGAIGLNGQDNFGVSDNFSHTGQVWLGGDSTAAYGNTMGNICFDGVYFEPMGTTATATDNIFYVAPTEATNPFYIHQLTLTSCYVNGHENHHLINVASKGRIYRLTLENNWIFNFHLQNNCLVARTGTGYLYEFKGRGNKFDVEDSGGTDLDPQDLLLAVAHNAMRGRLHYGVVDVVRQTGDTSNSSTFDSNINIAYPAAYIVTILDIYDSGGDKLIGSPQRTLCVRSADDTDFTQLNANSDWGIALVSDKLRFTNNTGQTRQVKVIIERIY